MDVKPHELMTAKEYSKLWNEPNPTIVLIDILQRLENIEKILADKKSIVDGESRNGKKE